MSFSVFVIVHLALTAAWFLLARRFRRTQQAACEALLIFWLPIVGLLILISWRASCLFWHCDGNRPEPLEVEDDEFLPSAMDYQADIVPLSDTYLLGDARLKRRLFTDAIKQEVVENPTILQDAVHDEDREITYYAVSMMTAHMEKVSEAIETVKKQLETEPTDALLDQYAGLLETYLEHGYGDAQSRSFMEHELRATLTQLVQHAPKSAPGRERQIRAFLRGKEYEEAEAACRHYAEVCAGEEGPVYMKLVLAASRHDAKGVQSAVAALRALPVRLSPRAITAIRYWGGEAS